MRTLKPPGVRVALFLLYFISIVAALPGKGAVTGTGAGSSGGTQRLTRSRSAANLEAAAEEAPQKGLGTSSEHRDTGQPVDKGAFNSLLMLTLYKPFEASGEERGGRSPYPLPLPFLDIFYSEDSDSEDTSNAVTGHRKYSFDLDNWRGFNEKQSAAFQARNVQGGYFYDKAIAHDLADPRKSVAKVVKTAKLEPAAPEKASLVVAHERARMIFRIDPENLRHVICIVCKWCTAFAEPVYNDDSEALNHIHTHFEYHMGLSGDNVPPSHHHVCSDSSPHINNEIGNTAFHLDKTTRKRIKGWTGDSQFCGRAFPSEEQLMYHQQTFPDHRLYNAENYINFDTFGDSDTKDLSQPEPKIGSGTQR